MVVSLLLAALQVISVSGACYFPDGSEQTNVAFQPCNQIVGSISMCCGTNWTNGIVEDDTCQGNGLCLNSYQGEPLYWRGSCTDKTWKSPECLKGLCTDNSNGGIADDNVAVTNCPDGSWCCGGSNTTCCTRGEGLPIAAIVGQSTVSSSSTSTASTASTSSVFKSSTTSTSSTGSITGTTLTSSTPSDTAIATTATSNTKAIIIGIVVGLGILSIVLGVISWLVLRRRRVAAGTSCVLEKAELHGSTPLPPPIEGNIFLSNCNEQENNSKSATIRYELPAKSPPTELWA